VRLILAGVDEGTVRVFERSGVLEKIGAANLIPATDEVLGPLDRAMAEATAWIAERHADAGVPTGN